MSKMTIEHLANQGKASALTDVQLAEIGNLILVNESLNGKLGEKVFSEKIKLLKNSSGVWLDENLKTQKSLGEKEIRNRSNFLAKLAFEKVWKI